MELTRRGFLKSVGAATLAVAAVGLLGGCEGGEMVGNANGLNDTAELNALDTRTLNRGQYAKGHLCGKGSGVSKFDYVQVLFYPNPQDAKTYLCCKIAAKEASLMLGI